MPSSASIDPGAIMASEARSWQRAARTAELSGEGPFALSAGDVDVAVVRAADGWIALSGLCPHQGALLGEGQLESGTLVCRNHGWRFDVASGKRQGGAECLARFAVKEEDGWLWIDARRAPVEGQRDAERTRTFDQLPGPRSLPLLGNSLQLDLSRLHQSLERWAGEYGAVYRMRIGRRRIVVVSDPALASKALRARPKTFRRPSNIEVVFRELQVEGVFSAEGTAWRPQRRLAMRALSQRHLDGFYETLHEVAETLLQRWERAAAEGSALDIQDEMMRFTVDVTTALVFGRNANTLENDEDRLQQYLAPVFPEFNRRLFAPIPLWRLVRMPRDRRLDRSLAEVRSRIGELIEQARARLEADPGRRSRPGNFLEAMLTATDEHGEPFSDELIYGNAIEMLLAGEDTTANTLAWAVHHLCDEPPAVEDLRGELTEVMGETRTPAAIDVARRLALTAAVAEEAMRLRPVAPLIFLQANEDTTLGDVAIPRGMEVVLLTRLPALDRELLAEPEAFRPRRWLDEQTVKAVRKAHAHIPFGSGPRICPGRSLALLEMRLVLATLYHNFDVERVGGGHEVDERFAFTMAPVNLRVRLRKRAQRDTGR